MTPPTNHADAVTIARLEARVDMLEDRFDRLEPVLQQLLTESQKIRDLMQQFQGGKTLIAKASAAIIALLVIIGGLKEVVW